MSSLTEKNKQIARDFFETLSAGSEKYLDFTPTTLLFGLLEIIPSGGLEQKKKLLALLKIFFLLFLAVLLSTLQV